MHVILLHIDPMTLLENLRHIWYKLHISIPFLPLNLVCLETPNCQAEEQAGAPCVAISPSPLCLGFELIRYASLSPSPLPTSDISGHEEGKQAGKGG